MQNPSVAIVILNWNGKKFLEKFLPSVIDSLDNDKYYIKGKEFVLQKKIIVADNASDDDSISFLELKYPAVTIIQNDGNFGFAKGYNSALKKVQADYFVLLNSDVEVTRNWVEPIIELMESAKDIGACQPKVLSYSDKSQFEYAGACGGWIDKFGYPFMRGRIFSECERDNKQYDDVQNCFWASGAALFVRAAAYKEMQGLDEFFFAHQEEIDFCWRLQLAGYKVMVQPASIVYHVGGGTLPNTSPRKQFLNFRNNLIMISKNLPLTEAIWKIPCRISLDALAAWVELFKGKGKNFLAIAKAHLHYFRWLLVNKKKSVFPLKKQGKIYGWYKGSIVWAYFIKKKKTFSQIIPFK